jgi:dienelactone hydrolase
MVASVDFTETSAKLTLAKEAPGEGSDPGVVYVLDLVGLYDPIGGAAAKVLKSGKVVVTLTKKDDAHFTWFDLRKTK